MPDPQISVIVPCYNGEGLIEECLGRIVAQGVSCEVIVVDDGSTDASLDRARNLIRKSPIEVVVIGQANRGPAAARNAGLRQARGKNVWFLDVDERPLAGFLSSALEVLEKDPAAVGVFCQIEFFNAHRSVEPWQRETIENTLPSNIVMRTETVRALGGFPEHSAFRGESSGEDGALRSELKKHGKIAKIPRVLLQHNVCVGSHFDYFLDRAVLENGRIAFRWLSKAERDGSLRSAIADYRENIRRRHQSRILDGFRATLHAGHDFNRFAARFASLAGSLHLTEGFALYTLAKGWPALGPSVEIGCGEERAACWLAAGCKEGGHEKLTAMHRFLGASENRTNGSPFVEKTSATEESKAAAFRHVLEGQGLIDVVTIRAGPSAESAREWKAPIRLLFIDGDPSYEASRQEFLAWSPFVVPHGLVILRSIGLSQGMTKIHAELTGADGRWQELMRFRSLAVLQRKGAPIALADVQDPSAQTDPHDVAERLRKEIESHPTSENFVKLALTLEKLNAWDDAIVSYRRAVEIQPDHADALNCLGILLARRRRFDEAFETFEKVLRLQPRRAGAYHNMGVACADQDRPGKAVMHFEQAIRFDPNHAEAHKGKGMALLKTGYFLEGWREYEWRWRCKDLQPLQTPAPVWDGSTLYGKTILLHSEQGFGDTIQFIRYARLVKSRGAIVIVAAPLHLLPILRSCAGIDRLVPRNEPIPPHDVHAPLLTLAGVIGTELDSIPCDMPYVHADPARIEFWRREFSTRDGFRIGVIWQGNPNHGNDANRSIPLASFRALAEIPGVRLLSLQVGKGNDHRRLLDDPFPVEDLSEKIRGAFSETAAVMRNLDLVICCDTAGAHLAGALGVRVWVALPFAADWRWLQHRDDTPWYPSMRLFRQSQAGDWQEVFRRIADAVRLQMANETPQSSLASGTYRYAESIASPSEEAIGDAEVSRCVEGESDTVHPSMAIPPALRERLMLARKLHREGNVAQAEQVLRQLVKDHPSSAEAWFQLAALLQGQSKLDQALDAYRRVVQLFPNHAEGHTSIGILLCRLGKKQEGEASFRNAIRIKPDHAQAHNNLGVVLAETGRRGEALASWQETVRIAPNYAEGHFNVAVGLAEAERADEAIVHYNTTIRLRPDFAEAYSNLGLLHVEKGEPSEAVVLLKHAVRLKPDFFDAHNNLGLALADLGRAEEALAAYNEALRLQQASPEVFNNCGTALVSMGRTEEGLACLTQSLRLKPNYPEARWHQALTWLQQGDMERGWPEYEWRWKRRRARPRRFEQPLWDGSSLNGKTILLWCEQGLGDNLQFIRYAGSVKARSGRVLVECPEKLASLFATCDGVDQVVPERMDLPSFDVQMPLLSLPGIFKTTPHTVPCEVPYFRADPERVERWRQLLASGGEGIAPAALGKRKIGIVWQGNPKHRWDRHRSFALEHFNGLARRDDVQLYSLQKGASQERIDAFARRFGLIDLGNRFQDFADTAAAIRNLDLVITCDSAPAHLAGALGIPVWTALATMSDWRWLLQRDDSPWYPTMRLFRQRRLGDWSEVFDRIESAIAHWLDARRSS
jgi:tetratricopeptide (TPR) repeat protein/ADP-heptose:LPS heptosyltransferase